METSVKFIYGLKILALLIALSILSGCELLLNKNITIENESFIYEVDRSGKNLHFIDKATGTDYLNPETASFCASVVKDGKEFQVSSVTMEGNQLNLEFNKAGVSVEIFLQRAKSYITMEISAIEGQVDSIIFLNIPLLLEGIPDESFAACALSMNLFTHVRQLPALQTHLWAACYERFGIKGAKIAILGVPQKEILPSIRKAIEHDADIPLPTKGGAWASMQKEGYGSYLMNFGTLTEGTVEEWIEMCGNLGFNQIDNHGGGNFFSFGDFKLNPEIWPGGWGHFKRINKRLHEAGISSIFHSYSFFIDKDSKYVTPVPSPELGYFKSFTLESSVDSECTEITVKESTANISTMTGFFVRNSKILRIGDELIEFNGVTDFPPFKFTGCKRGTNGTMASKHKIGEKAYHLKEMFGRFVPGAETNLFREIAKKTAEIVNECNFDGIYFDAIDGSDILGGKENFWYYGTKFIFEVASHLKRPVGMEMSSMSHHWWHYRSRWQAWDKPVRGYKRFVDIHLASIKSDEIEHGLWYGDTKQIEKLAPMENGRLQLPLHLGWWSHQAWNPPQVEPTFVDDIEYLCCKMIGNNAGLSMLGGADKKTLDEYPAFKRLNSIIKQYEELRHKGYFNDSIRSLLRQPGKEYTLFQKKDRTWNFKPARYHKHKVEGLDHPSANWTVHNEFETQPVSIRIEPLMAVKSYDYPDNIVLSDFSNPGEFFTPEAADGVSVQIDQSKTATPNEEACGEFYAYNTGDSPKEGSWCKIEKKFEPPLNLSRNQGLGVWVNGDGNGELLNLSIKSPKHISHGAKGDHFIKIDFNGWKYFELVEIESSKSNDYLWPKPVSTSDFYVYDSYRHTVSFEKVNGLQLWYNSLPAGKKVKCQLGPVKAIPLVPITIHNPSLTVGGKTVTFPVKMESGMYLEFTPGTSCCLYGKKGELIKEVLPEGSIPNLVSGDNEIKFFCSGQERVSKRVQVTIISKGESLE
ncbi:carbohydrate binding domain-containing protein [Mariniphaga sediminis]|uniref:carbohydrate binding domain-containing protein n=1 Tax=Mariniphaga sediminis TaxID=1628158 RepID=UPI003565AFA0